MATATLTRPEPSSASVESEAEKRVYRCDCGNTLRVFGLGRHRLYFEAESDGSESAVLNRVCPSCQLMLPGKNAQ